MLKRITSAGNSGKPVRILLADDHEIFRRGLRALLEVEGGWTVVGEASNGREAVQLAKKLKPELVLMDICMPELNGLEAIRQIRKVLPGTRILVVTIHSAETLMQEIISAGAEGYVLKSDAGRELVDGVRAVIEGRPYFTARAAKLVLTGFLKGHSLSKNGAGGLSAREREVVQMIAEGKSTKEIAVALGVSLYTAETHRARIMRKLELGSIAGLTRYAVRNRIIEP